MKIDAVEVFDTIPLDRQDQIRTQIRQFLICGANIIKLTTEEEQGKLAEFGMDLVSKLMTRYAESLLDIMGTKKFDVSLVNEIAGHSAFLTRIVEEGKAIIDDMMPAKVDKTEEVTAPILVDNGASS